MYIVMLSKRIGDSLVRMTNERLDTILNDNFNKEDWTKVIIEDATINDLDEEAIKKARIEFVKEILDILKK